MKIVRRYRLFFILWAFVALVLAVGLANAAPKVGYKAVTTSGTPVALSTTRAVGSITVQAKKSNTNRIYFSHLSTGIKGNATSAVELDPGESVTISGNGLDLAGYYIDANVSGEAVSFIYE